MEGTERDELLDLGHDVVVDERRTREVVAALDDAVPYCHDVGLRQAGTLLVEQAQNLGQAEAVVRDGLGDVRPLPGALVSDGAGGVSDALDDARGERLP